MSKTVKQLVGVALIVFGAITSWAGGAFLVKAGLLLIATAGKKRAAATTTGTELELSGDPVDVRKIPYGEAWTAGTLRFRGTVGANNQDLYLVIVLSGCEIDSVQAVRADDEAITLDGSGNVTAPSKWVGRMNIRYYLGSDSQTADSTLDSTFASWTTDHRLRGLAYAIVKLTFDETNLNAIPQFRFRVRGRRVYDPRLDSTQPGGSGAQRLADPATWTWSRNPILQARDFLGGVSVNSIYIAGLGIGSSGFNWPNVMAEANVCEENVALAAGGNEDRYTGDGMIDPRQTPADILRHFELAIAGDITESVEGVWWFFAGAYRAPTLHLQAQHFIGPLRYTAHGGEIDRVDTAEGRYASLVGNYGTVVDFNPVRLASAVVGSEKLASYDFQLVADTNDAGTSDGGARAQRIADLLLEREAARVKRITCTTSLYGLRCVPGESVQLTHAAFGLTAQTMRVIEVSLRVVSGDDDKIGLAVELALEAGPASLYAWSATEVALSPAPVLPQAFMPPPPLGWTPVVTANVIGQVGGTFTKIGGSAAWNTAQVYSEEGYDACAVVFEPKQTTAQFMVGLNSDPAADADYLSIDYALYCTGSGTLQIYESGSLASSHGTYSVGDQLEVRYDGVAVRYLHNGTMLRTVPRSGQRLYLDSSIVHVGGSFEILSFAPINVAALAYRAEMQDEFNYLSAADLWRMWIQHTGGAGAGDISLLTGITDAPGGTAVRFGNNSGNDEFWGAFTGWLIPYDGISLYEVGVIARRVTGAGTFFCGLEGVAQDRVTLINSTGANSTASQHYLAASGVALGSSFSSFRGYARGWSSTPSNSRNDPRAPGAMYTASVFVRPMFIANYDDAAGQTDVAAIWVRKHRINQTDLPYRLALNVNPTFQDSSGAGSLAAWDANAGASYATTDGQSGRMALRVILNDSGGYVSCQDRIPIDQNETYEVSVWARQPSGDRINYLFVRFWDGDGAEILSSSGGGWSWGTYAYWGVVGAAFPTTWTYYSISFGPAGENQAPSNARYCAIGGLIPYTGSTSTTVDLQDFRIIKQWPATYRQSTTPTNAPEGSYWIDTDDNRRYRYNGASWDQVDHTGVVFATNSIQSFTPTYTGFSTDPTGDWNYIDFGGFVYLWPTGTGYAQGTSNATTFTITNLPSAIQPNDSAWVSAVGAVDNGNGVLCVANIIGGTITFIMYDVLDPAGSWPSTATANLRTSINGWTASGSKAITAGSFIIYAKG